jgi:hypothetical protein
VYGDLQSRVQEGSVSTDDVEKLLEFQVDEMQSSSAEEALLLLRVGLTW